MYRIACVQMEPKLGEIEGKRRESARLISEAASQGAKLIVLPEAAAAGYGGLGLGPFGYVPLDLPVVSEALTARGLYIVAGTIFDDLVAPARRADLLRQTREICALITGLPKPPGAGGQRYPAPYLTVMDWGHDERDFAAGHSARAPRLSAEAWDGMMATIRAIAEVARDESGVRAVVHPHAGGYIEFRDEIDRLAADIPADVAGFCIDTGHSHSAGTVSYTHLTLPTTYPV